MRRLQCSRQATRRGHRGARAAPPESGSRALRRGPVPAGRNVFLPNDVAYILPCMHPHLSSSQEPASRPLCKPRPDRRPLRTWTTKNSSASEPGPHIFSLGICRADTTNTEYRRQAPHKRLLGTMLSSRPGKLRRALAVQRRRGHLQAETALWFCPSTNDERTNRHVH